MSLSQTDELVLMIDQGLMCRHSLLEEATVQMQMV
jgi:hypothetical protein